MKIEKTKNDYGITITNSEGKSLTIKWGEFWQICREGDRINVLSEVKENLEYWCNNKGYDANIILKDSKLLNAIIERIIQERINNESSGQIFDAFNYFANEIEFVAKGEKKMQKMNKKQQRENLNKALDALDLWFEAHDTVLTWIGVCSTDNGYKLSEIYITDDWIKLTIDVLDRSIRENDIIRDGDSAIFKYVIKTNFIAQLI